MKSGGSFSSVVFILLVFAGLSYAVFELASNNIGKIQAHADDAGFGYFCSDPFRETLEKIEFIQAVGRYNEGWGDTSPDEVYSVLNDQTRGKDSQLDDIGKMIYCLKKNGVEPNSIENNFKYPGWVPPKYFDKTPDMTNRIKSNIWKGILMLSQKNPDKMEKTAPYFTKYVLSQQVSNDNTYELQTTKISYNDEHSVEVKGEEWQPVNPNFRVVDMTIDNHDNIYLLGIDYSVSQNSILYMEIQVYDNSGKFVRGFGNAGPYSDVKTFYEPSKIAVDSHGNIYVDKPYHFLTPNAGIQVFDSNGNYLKTFSNMPAKPKSIFVGPWDRISFTVGNELLMFDSNGNEFKPFPQDAFLIDYGGIVVDSSSNTYVTQNGIYLVKFNAEGKPQNKWEIKQNFPYDDFSNLAIDKNDVIFLATAKQILALDTNGKILASFGIRCSDLLSNCTDPDGAGPLRYGYGQYSIVKNIKVSSTGIVYVLTKEDTSPYYKIIKYDLNGKGPFKFANIGSHDDSKGKDTKTDSADKKIDSKTQLDKKNIPAKSEVKKNDSEKKTETKKVDTKKPSGTQKKKPITTSNTKPILTKAKNHSKNPKHN